jgi:branched-chain amino acid transport system substrate-binding protein
MSEGRMGIDGGRLWWRTVLILCLLIATPLRAEDIVIGMSAAFRGPSRALGIEFYRGSMAYFDQVNLSGGVHGRRIVLVPYDDGYNPLPALRNTLTLVEKDDAFLLFGYVGTPTVTRVLPLLKMNEQRPLYLLFPFTGANPQRQPPYDRFVFNLRASYHEETRGLVDHFVQQGLKKFAVFYQIDAYGRSGWEGVRKALGTHGLQMVGESTYRRGLEYSEDLSGQVDILRRAGAEAVISVGSYAACAAFIRDARDAGWRVPIANLSFVGSESLLELLKEEGRTAGRDYTANLVISQVVPSYEATALPAVREYRELMAEQEDAVPGEYAGEGYSAPAFSSVSFEGFLSARLLAVILERLGDPPLRSRLSQTIEGIRNLDLGIGAPISFGPDRHQGMDTVYYVTVKDGKLTQLDDWSTLIP